MSERFVLVAGRSHVPGRDLEAVVAYFGEGLPPRPDGYAGRPEEDRAIGDGSTPDPVPGEILGHAVWEAQLLQAAELVVMRLPPGGGHFAVLRLARVAREVGRRLVVVCDKDHWARASAEIECGLHGARLVDDHFHLIPALQPYADALAEDPTSASLLLPETEEETSP